MDLEKTYNSFLRKLADLLEYVEEDESEELQKTIQKSRIKRYKNKEGTIYIYILKSNDETLGIEAIITSSNQFKELNGQIDSFGFIAKDIKGSFIKYRTKREFEPDIIWFGVATSANAVKEFKIVKPMNTSQDYTIEFFDLNSEPGSNAIAPDEVCSIIDAIIPLKNLNEIVKTKPDQSLGRSFS